MPFYISLLSKGDFVIIRTAQGKGKIMATSLFSGGEVMISSHPGGNLHLSHFLLCDIQNYHVLHYSLTLLSKAFFLLSFLFRSTIISYQVLTGKTWFILLLAGLL